MLANATGFGVGRRGMYGPACGYVRELAKLLPAEAMLAGGIVDYSVGAAPHTGGFVVVHEENPYKKTQLAYYKLGDGPFYVFYTPFHLPHIQLPSTIARAVIHATRRSRRMAGPSCEVVTVAKRDLKAGERLDGVGGFCSLRADREPRRGARHQRPADRDVGRLRAAARYRARTRSSASTTSGCPRRGSSDELWQEQLQRWPSARSTDALAERATPSQRTARDDAARLQRSQRAPTSAFIGEDRSDKYRCSRNRNGRFRRRHRPARRRHPAGGVRQERRITAGTRRRSATRKGFLFDLGPHISFTKDPRIQALFAKNVDDKYEAVQVKLDNYWHGHWLTHPVQLHLNGLPHDLIVEIIADFVKEHMASERPIDELRGLAGRELRAQVRRTVPDAVHAQVSPDDRRAT